MWSLGVEIWRILSESAVYLLIGFGLAGVLHVVLPMSPWLARLLAGRGLRPVALAALLGVPMPLCSCSVVPAAIALRKKGAGKGATLSFLVSDPETDITSIILTFGLLGPFLAIFRPIAAIGIAIIVGLVTDLLDRDEPSAPAAELPERGSACGDEHGHTHHHSHTPDPPVDGWRGKLTAAVRFGYVEFFDDLIGSLLLGVVLGGLLTLLLPRIGLAHLPSGSWITMLAMVVISVPMYVCASASTPIAAGMIAAGVSPGAALVFLLAGPATNLATILIVWRQLGRRTLLVYVLGIAVLSVAAGVWLDAIVRQSGLKITPSQAVAAESGYSPLKLAASVVLLALALQSLRRTRALARAVEWLGARSGLRLPPRVAAAGLAIVLLASYWASGWFVVGPGERGVATRFGRITAAHLGSGLHYAWPYPFGRSVRVAVAQVRRVELGFRSAVPTPAAADARADEAWMLTGNEDIITIKAAVQYVVPDREDAVRNFLFGSNDPEAVIRAAAEAALRAVAAQRGIDTLYTTARGEVETEVRDRLLQPALDRCGVGVRVVAVDLREVHAPEEVHYAFRDVASATEDKMTSIHLGYEYDERVTRESRGQAGQALSEAAAAAYGAVAAAQGRAAAFVARLEAYRAAPAVFRLRAYLETMDAVLPDLKKIVNLVGERRGELDLWLTNTTGADAAALPPLERAPGP